MKTTRSQGTHIIEHTSQSINPHPSYKNPTILSKLSSTLHLPRLHSSSIPHVPSLRVLKRPFALRPSIHPSIQASWSQLTQGCSSTLVPASSIHHSTNSSIINEPHRHKINTCAYSLLRRRWWTLECPETYLQTLSAEGMLAGKHLWGRIEPFQTHGTLEQVVQQAFIHGFWLFLVYSSVDSLICLLLLIELLYCTIFELLRCFQHLPLYTLRTFSGSFDSCTQNL